MSNYSDTFGMFVQGSAGPNRSRDKTTQELAELVQTVFLTNVGNHRVFPMYRAEIQNITVSAFDFGATTVLTSRPAEDGKRAYEVLESPTAIRDFLVNAIPTVTIDREWEKRLKAILDKDDVTQDKIQLQKVVSLYGQIHAKNGSQFEKALHLDETIKPDTAWLQEPGNEQWRDVLKQVLGHGHDSAIADLYLVAQETAEEDFSI